MCVSMISAPRASAAAVTERSRSNPGSTVTVTERSRSDPGSTVADR